VPVSHVKLLYRLQYYGIDGCLLNGAVGEVHPRVALIRVRVRVRVRVS